MVSFLAVFSGWVIQGFLGIGSGIISTAILLFFYDAKTVVVSLSVVALLGTLYLSYLNYRGNLFLKEVTTLSVFSFIGVLTGSFFLQILDQRFIHLIFGIVVVFTGFYDYYLRGKIFIKNINGKYMSFFIGTAGGIISGLIGGSGPLYAFYLNHRFDSKEDFKFVLSAVFSTLNVERMTFYLLSSDLNKSFSAEIILPGVLGVFAGAYIGNLLTNRLSTQKFKKIVSISIMMSGLYFVYKGITQ